MHNLVEGCFAKDCIKYIYIACLLTIYIFISYKYVKRCKSDFVTSSLNGL